MTKTKNIWLKGTTNMCSRMKSKLKKFTFNVGESICNTVKFSMHMYRVNTRSHRPHKEFKNVCKTFHSIIYNHL